MPTYLYISLQQDDRIDQYAMDRETGELGKQAEFPLAGMPAPLASDPSRRFLFAGRRKAGESACPVSGSSRGREACPGSTTCPWTGILLTYQWTVPGTSCSPPTTTRPGSAFDSAGALDSSPIEWRETGIGAHYIQTDPSNSYAFTPHIAEGSRSGANAIFQFRFDADSERLTPNSPDRTIPNAPEGPRHFCFHPALDVLYTSNGQGCGVTAYHFAGERGTLAPFQTVSTLPDGYAGNNSCSQIQVTASGRFLYAPNRGPNSIAGFALDASDGSLTALGQTPTEPIPRAFSLDPAGSFLYAAGLESGRLACYRVNPNDGNLEPRQVYDVGNGPMGVLIIDL